jgi:hypothetical protein
VSGARVSSGAPNEPLDRDRYQWIALSNTTLATLIATIDLSVVLIALPDIFRGIGPDRPVRHRVGLSSASRSSPT